MDRKIHLDILDALVLAVALEHNMQFLIFRESVGIVE